MIQNLLTNILIAPNVISKDGIDFSADTDTASIRGPLSLSRQGLSATAGSI